MEEIKIKRRSGMPVFKNPAKHEEIKRMAWEFCNTNYKNLKKMHIWHCIEMSWQMAEEFYNYAKEKEEEANETN